MEKEHEIGKGSHLPQGPCLVDDISHRHGPTYIIIYTTMYHLDTKCMCVRDCHMIVHISLVFGELVNDSDVNVSGPCVYHVKSKNAMVDMLEFLYRNDWYCQFYFVYGRYV